MRICFGLIGLIAVITACTPSEKTSDLMSWGDLTERTLPQPTATYPYGDAPAQVADLWLPLGEGPHPVVLMIHGGCWQKSIADRTLMNYAAEDLRQRGLAVWNIEYHGVDEDGGGYPGTFLDVRAAANDLFERGPSLGLDTNQTVAFGHSAGGHLAAWLAVQHNIDTASDIGAGPQLPIKAVIVSGGLADLEASIPITLDTCLANIAADLTGTPNDTRANVFSDTSVTHLFPAATPLISVNGDSDHIAPPKLGFAFTWLAKTADTPAQYVEIEDSGHVELIAPGTPAFDTQAALIEAHITR